MSESASTTRGVIRWALTGVLLIAAVLAGVMFGPKIRSMVEHNHEDETVVVAEDGAAQYYTCGMHPWVILPTPGDCPICHMKLTPLDPAKFTGEIVIDPAIVQNIGVRTSPVVMGPVTRSIRTVGSVENSEQAVRDVNLKVDGWIESLHVDFVGASVKAGDPLFDLYSPRLYAAQEEYLLALRASRVPAAMGGLDLSAGAAEMLESARTRLALLDVTDEQIAQLERDGKASKVLTIRSPHTGVVLEKRAAEGMKVDPGTRVYRIADLSKVWVIATVYEQQLPFVEEGMSATVALPYLPGQVFEGMVSYIYPTLDARTRQTQVRVVLDNAGGVLKPGMFAEVRLSSTAQNHRTLVPRSAVLNTGTRRMVFISHDEGHYEPRPVTTGIETGEGMIEIIAGVNAGESVVTSGQFLLDSESNMREAMAKRMTAGASTQPATTQPATTRPAEHVHP